MSESNFLPVDKSFEADFGDIIFHLHFKSSTELTYDVIKAPQGAGTSETVQIKAVEIRPKVYMVYWKEANKSTVVHVEDFEEGIVYTNITMPDNTFNNMKGTLKEIS